MTDRPTTPSAAPDENQDDSPELIRLRAECVRLAAELAEARQASDDWRTAALGRWDEVAATAPAGPAVRELDAVHSTVSWRVTRPLRAVSRLRQLARGAGT